MPKSDSIRTAVLLMAYGSPNSLDEVEPYMRQVRHGRAVTQAEVDRLKGKYASLGGKTPLLQITQAQAKALELELDQQGVRLPVFAGMKHWHPFIEGIVRKIISAKHDSIVGIALAPHYSRLSIGGYEDAVNRGLVGYGSTVSFRMVRSWHTNEFLIRALSTRVQDSIYNMGRSDGTATVLFTAHSLPKKAVAAEDPYCQQLLETSQLVASLAGIHDWDFAFQSAGEPNEDWLGPNINDQISKLAKGGFSEIVACPVGFVADHLEILYDLDIEAKQYARSLGVKFERTRSLNDDPEFIKALASTAISALKTPPPLQVS